VSNDLVVQLGAKLDQFASDMNQAGDMADMLDLARHIVEQKSGSFEPGKFEDQYETALVDLINQKRSGKPITPKERPHGENVVDLMDALRKSMAAPRPNRRLRESRPRSPGRRPPARRKC
jgi:DNA end-binding protein Ku